MAEEGLIFRAGFADACDQFFWDHQHMHRCLWLDIVNGDAELVLMGDLGGDFPSDDFLKEGESQRN